MSSTRDVFKQLIGQDVHILVSDSGAMIHYGDVRDQNHKIIEVGEDYIRLSDTTRQGHRWINIARITVLTKHG
jgi:hypothetical protein